ncbi:MAG: transporter substrate-binding domain-containing protein, partial [Oscillospiraceae bacterium]
MKKDKSAKGTFLLCTILLLLALSLPVFATQKQEVKVAYYPSEGFWELDANGIESGYGADYLYGLSKYLNWDVKYIHYTSQDQAAEGMYNGEVDLMLPTIKNFWADDFGVYSKEKIFSGYNTLVAKDTREDLFYNDAEKLNSCKIGIITGFPGFEKLEIWLQEQGISPTLVYFENFTQLATALDKGEVDAIATNIVNTPENTKVVAKFTGEDAYALASKNNGDLVGQLDGATRKLLVETPTFLSDLFGKYFSAHTNTPFSKQELDYAAKMPKLKVGCSANSFPNCYIDRQTGDIIGIVPDILHRMEELSGLKFDLVDISDGQVIDMAYLANNDISIVSGAEYTGYVKSLQQALVTTPYLNAGKVLVARDNFDFDFKNVKIATASVSIPSRERLQRMFPDCEIVKVDSVEACFAAVKNGSADLAFESEYSVLTYLRGPRYASLRTVPGYT